MSRISEVAALGAAVILLGVWQAPLGAQTQQPEPVKPAEVRGTKPAGSDELLNRSGVGMEAAAPVDPKAYKIGPEDILGVNVWKEKEFSGQFSVRPDGKITLPLIGDMVAVPLTPDQLQGKIAEALTKYLNEPRVIVSVVEVRSKRYYVSGEVNKSGPVALVTPTTVLQALSSCGMREWAKKKKIVILRGTERLKFNYEDVVKGKKMEQNIPLQDGDHIVVP
jgi:polysaccharide export outer membrane protein